MNDTFDLYYFMTSDDHPSYATRVDGIPRVEEPSYTIREPKQDILNRTSLDSRLQVILPTKR